MSDPTEDHVPHMVPANPGWRLPWGEKVALVICAITLALAIYCMWTQP